jgi:YidC/Oxa1 family membrane protein insertase
MAALAGIFQFFQTKMLLVNRPPKAVRSTPGAKDEDMMATMNKTMIYFMPVITVVIGASLPGGLVLYWIVINVLSIVQQYLVLRGKKKAEVPTGLS